MSYEIAIFQSETLAGEHGDDPKDNVAVAIIDALYEFDIGSYVNRPNVDVPAPTENIGESIFTSRRYDAAPDPPNPNLHEHTYDYLLDWWRDYTQYQIKDWKLGNDSNLLLTKRSNSNGLSGRAGNGTNSNHATMGRGHECAEFQWELNSGQSKYHDDSTGYAAVQTAIHEIGHNLLKNEEADEEYDCDDGAAHHLMGNAYFFESANWPWLSDRYAGSPMSRNAYFDCMAQGGENFCGNNVNYGADDTSAGDLRFSMCARNKLRDPL